MMIRPSAALRNDYAAISELAKTTQEPIYITKNGEGDLVVMSIEAYERREQLLELRASILKAEERRLSGIPGKSLDTYEKELGNRYDAVSD